MKSIETKVKEEVLACSEDIRRLTEFWEQNRTIVPELFPIYKDYMRIYENVMMKHPDLNMEERKNLTYVQLTNLYKAKKTEMKR